jgi:hypothetical protein
MAELQQINPMITEATRDLLRRTAQERKCSQGKLVEAALLAFLRPGEAQGTEPLLFERLLAIEEVLGQIMGMLKVLVTMQEAQVKPEPVPIATYEQMYGPIPPSPEPVIPPPWAVGEEPPSAAEGPAPHPVSARPPSRRGRLRRWFFTEDPA